MRSCEPCVTVRGSSCESPVLVFIRKDTRRLCSTLPTCADTVLLVATYCVPSPLLQFRTRSKYRCDWHENDRLLRSLHVSNLSLHLRTDLEVPSSSRPLSIRFSSLMTPSNLFVPESPRRRLSRRFGDGGAPHRTTSRDATLILRPDHEYYLRYPRALCVWRPI